MPQVEEEEEADTRTPGRLDTAAGEEDDTGDLGVNRLFQESMCVCVQCIMVHVVSDISSDMFAFQTLTCCRLMGSCLCGSESWSVCSRFHLGTIDHR